MSCRRNCINNSSFSYTGKEQSPLRFGLSAEGYPVNSILEGFDKNIWVVEIKNNRKIWVRKDDDFRITYEQPLINKLEDYNKTVDIENISEVSGIDDNIEVKSSVKNTKKSVKNVKKTDIENVRDTESTCDNIETKVVKKPTNYNIFLTYRLKMLKEEYKRDGKNNKDKEIFKMVIKEWNDYKTKPAELKIILEQALSYT